jgi:hypothetical protein
MPRHSEVIIFQIVEVLTKETAKLLKATLTWLQGRYSIKVMTVPNLTKEQTENIWGYPKTQTSHHLTAMYVK